MYKMVQLCFVLFRFSEFHVIKVIPFRNAVNIQQKLSIFPLTHSVYYLCSPTISSSSSPSPYKRTVKMGNIIKKHRTQTNFPIWHLTNTSFRTSFCFFCFWFCPPLFIFLFIRIYLRRTPPIPFSPNSFFSSPSSSFQLLFILKSWSKLLSFLFRFVLFCFIPIPK